MAETMIRKQVYLRREHDRKIKSLAAQRGCTEAEVIREAVERLPEPEDEAVAKLRAAGLLLPRPDFPDLPSGAELEALRAEVDAWLDEFPNGLHLAEEVIAERRESLW
jgi:hypothetical protein